MRHLFLFFYFLFTSVRQQDWVGLRLTEPKSIETKWVGFLNCDGSGETQPVPFIFYDSISHLPCHSGTLSLFKSIMVLQLSWPPQVLPTIARNTTSSLSISFSTLPSILNLHNSPSPFFLSQLGHHWFCVVFNSLADDR